MLYVQPALKVQDTIITDGEQATKKSRGGL
jgi:hypothetical protein